uniref:Uncharacterized protein n=1 Tax=Oryza brachyantha TaxID=4533 RepID=J3MIV2_ORYBR
MGIRLFFIIPNHCQLVNQNSHFDRRKARIIKNLYSKWGEIYLLCHRQILGIYKGQPELKSKQRELGKRPPLCFNLAQG